jgi:hypothetical protein
MKAFMAPAAQKVLQSIAELDLGRASETGQREGDLMETVDLFFRKGLLQQEQEKSSSSAAKVHAAG